MSDQSKASLPVRIILKFVLNIALIWLLDEQFPQYFALTGGTGAYVIVAALLTLLNMFLRPVLAIITYPFKLFAAAIAIIIVHGVFIQAIVMVVDRMDPSLVSLSIQGGLIGWVFTAVILGLGNWLMKLLLK